jgi:hypothetical protein
VTGIPTGTATAIVTATPTATGIPTGTAAVTATPTATISEEGAACAGAADAALRACVAQANAAIRDCYLSGGSTCSGDDANINAALATLDDAVRDGCPDASAAHAAGFGALFTLDSLVGRLQAACRAETTSLGSRSFGGPQGAALTEADDAARACLTTAHQGASALLDTLGSVYHDCLAVERNGGTCNVDATEAKANEDIEQTAIAVGTACASLPALVSVDPPTFAARAAAQARCLTAIANPASSPLHLDCGPRADLIDTPRGEYVQVVLDSDTYGTRCGDGSPFAFWIRLAPEGSPVDHVVVGMQGGGVCITGDDCATRPADLFEALNDQPETGGPLSNDSSISPFADWTKVYLPYCNQDVFIGGGATSNFDQVTVHRFGAVNVRAALRYVCDVLWRELDRDTERGYRADGVRSLFGGFSAGGFGTIYNYHWVLDDLEWAHTAAYPDAGLALDNGETVGVKNLGVLLISNDPPLGWGSQNYLPSYCTTTDCGVGPILLERTSPRLLGVPEQQILVLSNQVDDTQVVTTFFDSTPDWINTMRASYCETRLLPGVNYFLPAIPESTHVISPRNEIYTGYDIDGVVLRDFMASVFNDPESVTDHAEEGTLVQAFPGVQAFPCPVTP